MYIITDPHDEKNPFFCTYDETEAEIEFHFRKIECFHVHARLYKVTGIKEIFPTKETWWHDEVTPF